MHFLYPSDPLRTKRPDEFYAAEFGAVQAAGFDASVFSLEEFQSGTFRTFPPLPPSSTIIYRGWMLSDTDYKTLISAVLTHGANVLTDATTYLATHHLPNWYPLISEFTPETRIFPGNADLAMEIGTLGWDEYFIKDYVKSLKTSIGSRICTPEQAAVVASEMCKFRGTIEGGFCVRRVEDFLPETEKRFFVLNSTPCAVSGEIPTVVQECAHRIQSRFFSVDIIERSDGVLRVVEIGDGQVSDIVGWTPEHFADCLAKHFGNQK